MKFSFQHMAHTLSVRLSLMVALPTALILTAALLVMLHFSRKSIKQETLQKAEQTLEATVQSIDNILLSVEQASGNTYWNMLEQLDKPERMQVYCRKLVETNPYITGCAIAMEPYYYKDHAKYFMTYTHQTKTGMASTNSPIIQAETFGNRPYTEQDWYSQPMGTGHPCWIGPLKNTDTEGGAIISFCLPIYNRDGARVGVLGVDIALQQLSQIVLAVKPSPNSYCTLLGSDGSYIVHPDSTKLMHETVYSYYKESDNQSIKEAVAAMVTGQTGYKEFQQNGKDWFVFYKPFNRSVLPGRSMGKLNWSAGIVYPEDDIFGQYNRMLYVVVAISLTGLFMLLVLCQWFTHRRLLPLRMLTKSAQRIAEGDYNDPIPDSKQEDEIGQLQEQFQQMQQSLATHVNELNRLRASLQIQGEELRTAYERAQEADKLKTAFLHHMTNQMIAPSQTILTSVDTLCQQWSNMSKEEAAKVVDSIQKDSQTITDLLGGMLNKSVIDKK
ncbi:MAG: HAMP domain-containing protein [Prevotella sp.]|nr:HAMP domain-containing protein [Prevotella sp.]